MHDDISQAKLRLLYAMGRAHDVWNDKALTPLALAIRSKNIVATRTFLDAGANVDMRLDRDQTVLHLASCLGNTEALMLLLERGAIPSLRDIAGMTPGETALACGHEELTEIPQNAIDQLGIVSAMDAASTELARLSNDSSEDRHEKLPYRPIYTSSDLTTNRINHVATVERSLTRYANSPSDGSMFGDGHYNVNTAQTPFPQLESPIGIFRNKNQMSLKRPYQSMDCAVLELAANKVRRA